MRAPTERNREVANYVLFRRFAEADKRGGGCVPAPHPCNASFPENKPSGRFTSKP